MMELFHTLGFSDGAHFAVFLTMTYILVSMGRFAWHGACRAWFTDRNDTETR